MNAFTFCEQLGVNSTAVTQMIRNFFQRNCSSNLFYVIVFSSFSCVSKIQGIIHEDIYDIYTIENNCDLSNVKISLSVICHVHIVPIYLSVCAHKMTLFELFFLLTCLSWFSS